MADAVVGLALMQLFAAEEWIRAEISRVVRVEKELKKVSSKLQSIRNVLDDAENRSIHDKAIQAWLAKLEDVSYEMEDVVDEWNTSRIRRRIHELEESAKKKMSFFPSKQVSAFCLTRDISLKIKYLNKRLERIIKEKDDFNFIPKELFVVSSFVTSENSLESKRISTSFVNSSQVYGRVSNKNVVLSQLLREGSKGNDRVQVHSIVGVGGVGKTTLAQLVYNDGAVEESFSKRIWVCVSNPFDQVKIANEIVEAIEGRSPNLSSLELLLQRVKRSISGEKFLLVLDDVWNEDEKKWEALKNCLAFGAIGSKVLATTRNERVARLLGTKEAGLHYLDQLSDTDCWLLFSQVAFGLTDERDHNEKFKEIGKGIIKKCKGLPLAVRALGSMLRFKRSIEEWKNVLESEMWELELANVELFPHLNLSYQDLSPMMKRCFSYCSIYPKGYRMYAYDLMILWMAQGFLTTSHTSSGGHNIEFETKGFEFVENLATRSFFQDVQLGEDGKIYSCKMHDIVHDFAQYVSKNECFIIESGVCKPKCSSSSGEQKTRHLTWFCPRKDISPSSVCDLRELRTMLTISVPLDRLQTAELIGSLKRVRTLILCNSGVEEVPKEIGKLIHLRCLGLRYNPLRELPDSVGDLSNLQDLDIKNCWNLSFLPDSIGKLSKLRHLVVDLSSPKFPQSIGNLTMLRTLRRIVIGRGFNSLGCLKNLNQLRGELQIVFEGELNGGTDAGETNRAELRKKVYIQRFLLDFNGYKVSEDVIEYLTPPPNIQNLEIRDFPGKYFPKWMSKSLNHLKVLEINDCEFASSLPPLGKLPSLETLYIGRIQNLRQVGIGFLGITSGVAFPKLVNLTFFGCKEWEEWEDIGSGKEEEFMVAMPRLRVLELIHCPKLKTLPHQLLRNAVSLEHLGIYECGVFGSEEFEKEEERIKILVTHIQEVEINYKRYTREF